MQPHLFYIGKLIENRITRPIKHSIIRSIAANSGLRALLNQYYSLLSDEAKSRFHARYSRIFREPGVQLTAGEWCIQFLGRNIQLPLRPLWSWLDWDSALSIIGHDIEVKLTYAALIASDQRPTLFLDIGANYGTHSVLFLSAGIPVIAFEPNPSCHSYFQTICELNGLSGRWEQVAIGDGTGHIELVYPEKETWLGSVRMDVVPSLKNTGKVMTQRVPLHNLDYYLNDVPCDKVLIKVDVEGFEREVIRGASQLLQNCKPKIIFESNDVATRNDLFRLLQGAGYCVHPLPYRPSEISQFLRVDEFLSSTATNFIAVSRPA